MVGLVITLLLVVAGLVGLRCWGRSKGDADVDLVPSGREVDKPRAWDIFNNTGNGSGVSGSV